MAIRCVSSLLCTVRAVMQINKTFVVRQLTFKFANHVNIARFKILKYFIVQHVEFVYFPQGGLTLG
jgi:hypothetical protein